MEIILGAECMHVCNIATLIIATIATTTTATSTTTNLLLLLRGVTIY